MSDDEKAVSEPKDVSNSGGEEEDAKDLSKSKESKSKSTPKKAAKPAAESGDEDEPAVSRTGRKRKAVVRLAPEAPTARTGVEVVEGKGKKLADIDNIAFNLERTNADKLTSLHRLLFNKPGTRLERKKNIRAFSGLVYNDESGREKVEEKVKKWMSAEIKFCLEVLDLERSGTKEKLVERLVDFLEKPKKSGKSSKRDAHEKKMAKKRKRSEKNKKSKKGKSKSKKKAKDASSSDDESDSDEPPAKKKKSETPKKSPKKASPKKKKEDSDEDEKPSDKKEPGKKEINAYFTQMAEDGKIDGSMSAKAARKMAEEHFGCDLSEKKKYIGKLLLALIDESSD